MVDRGFRYYPALKLAVPFAVGIAVAGGLQPAAPVLVAALLPGLVLLAAAMLRDLPLRSVALLLILVSSGALAISSHRDHSTERLAGMRGDGFDAIGTIAAEPEVRNGRCEITLRVDSILYRNDAAVPETLLLIRLADSTTHRRLHLIIGDRIAARGTVAVPRGAVNPGAPDYAAVLGARGITLTMDADDRAAITVIERAKPGPFDRLLSLLRDGAREFADRHVRGGEGEIVKALLLGEQKSIDPETRDAFMRTGTVHVLSVSGLHVGIIALGLFVLVSWIPNRRAQILFFVPPLALYVVIAGAGPSILRAAIMAVAFLVARSASRIARPLNTLGLAGLVLLAFDPAALFDLGFQLSFVSVAGVLTLYGPLRGAAVRYLPMLMKRAALRYPIEMIILSFCAQVFTLPIIGQRFGYVALGGALANIAVVPLTSMALGAAAVGAIVTPVADLPGAWFGGAAYLAVAAAEKIVLWCAALPWAGVELRPLTSASAFALAAVTLYASAARTFLQGAMRGVAYLCALVTILLVDPFLDPLACFDERCVAILSVSRRSVAVVRERSGALEAVADRIGTADSAGIARAVETLRRRIGARSARIIALDSLSGAHALSAFKQLGTVPEELVHRRLPLLLAATGQRALAPVRLDRETLLEVPLRGELAEGIVLRYERRWEIIRWR